MCCKNTVMEHTFVGSFLLKKGLWQDGVIDGVVWQLRMKLVSCGSCRLCVYRGICIGGNGDGAQIRAFVTTLLEGGRSRKTIENIWKPRSSILRSAKKFCYTCGQFSSDASLVRDETHRFRNQRSRTALPWRPYGIFVIAEDSRSLALVLLDCILPVFLRLFRSNRSRPAVQ
jgi:hypothetical protein